MAPRKFAWLAVLSLAAAESGAVAQSDLLSHPPNTWIKRSPGPGAPVSPRLGYEGACVWDNKHQVIIRYAGHNQGGGGEQNSEIWTCDPLTWKWTLKEPNLAPPGVCCGSQNVYDPVRGQYLRFPSFSGSHGWQWRREILLNDSSLWTYDLSSNTWRNMRPLPAPRLAPLRSASWDSHEEVALVFGGEGGPKETVAYDPHRNEWRWLNPPAQPEPRSGGQMVYDSARKLHVLFGSQFNNEASTWLYDFQKNEWRDAQPDSLPPTEQNDAVLAYDPLRRHVLALVKISTGKEEEASHRIETWSYDAGANQWAKLNPSPEPESSGSRARQLVFAPELGVAVLENCPSKPREQQLWTYRAAGGEGEQWEAPKPKAQLTPKIVEDPTASVLSTTRVELTWKAPADPSVTGYHVERAVVEVLSEDQLTALKQQTAPLAEPSVGALHRISSFERITSAALKEPAYTDTGVDLGKPLQVVGKPLWERSFRREQLDPNGRAYRFAVFAYRIRSVNAGGQESGPSAVVFTIPSSPHWVFSKEEGETCTLKWSPNAEKELRGYRVYRMNGRYDKDAIPRLTDDPIIGNTWSDAAAGKSTRRYYVLAVDALGQEGFPSAPVWFEREWKQYYKPFTGEWHQ